MKVRCRRYVLPGVDREWFVLEESPSFYIARLPDAGHPIVALLKTEYELVPETWRDLAYARALSVSESN